jgi:hypothetical protein
MPDLARQMKTLRSKLFPTSSSKSTNTPRRCHEVPRGALVRDDMCSP